MRSSTPLPTKRESLLERLAHNKQVDLIVIGGGATGLGVALDASLRGLSVVLLEASDFAKGTSSRATKLIHGGVRYLAQGDISLVREALHERYTLLKIAPHLVGRLPFVMPGFACWETPFYGAGLKAYDFLSGRYGIGPTQFLNAYQITKLMSGISTNGLKGGVKYWDAQFDDARLALALARTAATQGALLLNYCPVHTLIHENGKLAGVGCHDLETGNSYTIKARAVINATGVWADQIRTMDTDSLNSAKHDDLLVTSQGAHVVVDQSFLPGNHAMLIPKTQDNRVLFAVPWMGKLILGTTDTPDVNISSDPVPQEQEINFILSEAGKYLHKAPQRSDVLSVWAGLRPLVKPQSQTQSTSSISRDYTIVVDKSGLLTVTGGKWTTYRSMADKVLQHCVRHGLLPLLPACKTDIFPLVGAGNGTSVKQRSINLAYGIDAYGSEAGYVQSMSNSSALIAPGLTHAMVIFAARHEYARTVEDILARRSRLLFLDAQQAADAAPNVAQILIDETGYDPQLNRFLQLAKQYQMFPERSL